MYMKKMKKRISQVFLLLFAGLFSVHAQSVKTHSSVENKFGVPNAKVTYSYYLDENGHEVRHGAYSISGTNSETSYGWEAGARMTLRTTQTINLKANFKHGKLNGSLSFKITNTLAENGKVYNRDETNFSYQFVDGELSGPTVQEVSKNGVKTEILRTGVRDKHRIGTYKSTSTLADIDASGAFDNDGNMTGPWVFKEQSEERRFDMLKGVVCSYAFYKRGSAKPFTSIESKIKPVAQSYAKGTLSLAGLLERGYITLNHKGLLHIEPTSALNSLLSLIDLEGMESFQEKEYLFGQELFYLDYDQCYVVENLSPDLFFKDAKALFPYLVPNDFDSTIKDGIFSMKLNPDKSITYGINYYSDGKDYVRKIVGDKFADEILDHHSSRWLYFDIPAEIVQKWIDEEQRELEEIRIREEEEALRLAEEKRKQEARAAWIVSAGEKLDAFTAKLLSVSDEHRSEILSAKTGRSGTAPCLDPSEWENLVDGYSLEKMLGLLPVLKISPVGKGKDNQYADYIVTFDKSDPVFSAETKQVRIYISEAETPKIDFSESFRDMRVVRGPWDQILEKVDSISSINSAILAETAGQKALAPFLNAYQNYHDACDLNGSPNLEETDARIEKTLETHQRYYRRLGELKTIADNDTYLQSALTSFKALKTAYSKYMGMHPLIWNDTLPEDYLHPVLFAQEGLKSAIQEEKVSAYNTVVKSESKTLPEQWFSKSTDSGQLYLLEKAETVKLAKKSTAKSGWTNAIEVGLFPLDTYYSDDWNGDGFIDEDRHFLDLFPGIGYSLGYKTGSGLYFGVAFDVLKDPNTNDNQVLPIDILASGDGRFYFNKERSLQPYIGARAGVALTSDSDGFFVNPNFGVSYNLGGKKMVFGTLGYMLYLEDYFAESTNGAGRISATIGFAF